MTHEMKKGMKVIVWTVLRNAALNTSFRRIARRMGKGKLTSSFIPLITTVFLSTLRNSGSLNSARKLPRPIQGLFQNPSPHWKSLKAMTFHQ